MDDLVSFLRARLGEDEAAARKAADAARTDVWIDGAEGSVHGVGGDMHLRGAVLSIDDIGPHIARWDPARVLAEVKAKQRLLVHIEGLISYATSPNYAHTGIEAWANAALNMLALPYADHAECRDEWRPVSAG